MSVESTAADAQSRVWFVRLALAAAALTFVVIVASAFMRHTQAGLSCADWPTCYGRLGDPGVDLPVPPTIRFARIAHRLAASSVLALVIGMLLVAWTQSPPWKREGGLALAALVVAGALAVLGIITPGARLPAVPLGNLLGGYLMLALFAATDSAANSPAARAASSTSKTTSPRPLRRVAFVLLTLAFTQAALGGMIGAQFGLTACPGLKCAALAGDSITTVGAFDPFRALTIDAGRVVPPADATWLHLAHRTLGIVVVVLTLLLARGLRRDDRRTAAALAVLAVVIPMLGIAAIAVMPSLPLAVLHNAAVAVLVAVLAHISARPTAPRFRDHGS